MPVTVYGDSISGNCLKVKWVLVRLGIPHRWVETSVIAQATRTPEFLAMNPAGQVPTVVLEDGRTLAQSNAIIFHFADGSDLIPADAYDRAKMLEWMFWEQYSHEPTIAVARFRKKFLHETVDPTLMDRGRAALARLELGLAGRRFLVGEGPSLADVALVAYTRWAGDGGFRLADYPAITDWIARVEQALDIAD